MNHQKNTTKKNTEKPTGITYMCCVCDDEFEIASELESPMGDH